MFKNQIVLFLIMLVLLPVYGQQYDFSLQTEKIDSLIDSYLPDEALSVIYEELHKGNYDKNQELELKLKELEVMVLSENYDQAIALSLKLLLNNSLTIEQNIRIRIQRALCFEILDQQIACKTELETIKMLFSKTTKNTKHYGVYLYRLASFYRVTGNLENAKKWAMRAAAFSKEHQFSSEYAVSSMILGFLESDANKQLNYFNRSLELWLKLGDRHGSSAMCIAISKAWIKLNNISKAKYYAIKSEKLLTGTTLYSSKSMAYFHLSELYEKTKQLDSALYYHKLYSNALEKNDIMLQSISVDLLESQLERQKKQSELALMKSENEKFKKLNFQLLFSITLIVICLLGVGFLLYKGHRKNIKIRQHEQELIKKNRRLKESISEKKILLKELHHRTKNNLSIVSGFIDFQFHDKERLDITDIESIKNRINSLAMAHQVILNHYDTQNESEEELCNLKEYFNLIASSLLDSDSRGIQYKLDIPDIILEFKTAIPLGIILNELITNTMIHGKTENSSLSISVKVNQFKDELQLIYSDNGKEKKSSNESPSNGSRIVEKMVKQLKGNMVNDLFDYDIKVKIKK
jgi:two-component system, sensor histidine kinase PdtaS